MCIRRPPRRRRATLDFTAEMYDRIVRTLSADAPAAGPAGPAGPAPASDATSGESSGEARSDSRGDARGEPRVGAHGGASALIAGTPRPVRVRDVSRNGFGLLTGVPVEAGEQFAVTLAGTGAMAGLSIVCSSVYCRPAGHGLYTVGAKLVRFTPRTS